MIEALHGRWVLIVPAAGRGLRFGQEGPSKQFIDVGGRSILGRTVDMALGIREFRRIIVATSHDAIEDVRDAIGQNVLEKEGGRISIVVGGETRQKSVLQALITAGSAAVDLVFVHDAVRPLASEALYRRVAAAAQEFGAATPALRLTDTIKEVRHFDEVHGDVVVSTPDRENYRRVQTPQAFRPELLLRAHQRAIEAGVTASDDAMLVEQLGERVACVEGEETNVKITTPSDLMFIRWLVQEQS